uniref:Endonuclease n=1 Tax=Firmicutes phage HS08 TaxID=3056391 RepID=A0AA49X283_9VIRU|nr:MAG: endonuclease [Firmicutes phage HS08]
MPRYSKYRAVKTKIDGHKFPSIKEAQRYQELKLLEKAGKIKNLELQPKFEIIPKQKYRGKTLRKAEYTPDFKYYDVDNNEWVIEEVKGMPTVDYVLRKKLFILKYGDEYKFLET